LRTDTAERLALFFRQQDSQLFGIVGTGLRYRIACIDTFLVAGKSPGLKRLLR
jgi:hypothetical protein